jgi:pyridoxal biosynthesis lyase PdxS
MLLHDGFRDGRFRGSGLDTSAMDRDFADAIINFALWRDPERVAEVIAEVAGQLEAKGYPAYEIAAAIDELLDELNGDGQPRH